MRFSVLASGSKGNSCYVETSNVKILVDAGLSCRELERRLHSAGLSAARLDAIIITHEHVDHVRGAGAVARRYSLPVYTTEGTLDAARNVMGKLPAVVPIRTGTPFTLGDMNIEPFTKCHDASDPFGLTFSCGGVKLGIATDLGRGTRLVEERLRGCTALVMELNYDSDMLDSGPYPLFLKRRIKGPEGHLSNGEGARLAASLAHEGLEILVCAHLSEINNNPGAAYREAKNSLSGAGAGHVRLMISDQRMPGPLLELHPRPEAEAGPV